MLKAFVRVLPHIRFCLVATALFSVVAQAPAQQPVSLMTPTSAWKFNNGAEFPGATGGVTVEQTKDGEVLDLSGDFTKGGLYVQIGRPIDKVDIRDLSFWVRNPDGGKLTLRLNDDSGQTHQIALALESTEEWQRVTFPVQRFFARRGQADAVTGVSKYESWGGAKDGKWHGPATAVYLLLGDLGKKQRRTIQFRDIAVVPEPTAVKGADVKTTIKLDEVADGQHDWRFTNGQEFKGAKGALSAVEDPGEKGKTVLKLEGDFTGGGVYVAGIKDLADYGAKDVIEFRLRVRSETGGGIRFQLKDGSGQTHQRPRQPVAADGKWHDIVIKPAEFAGGEHWGGANDGKWHGAPTQLVVSLAADGKDKSKTPTVYLADVTGDAIVPSFVQPAAFRAGFEGAEKVPEGWKAAGGVSVDPKTGFKGTASLMLSRTLDEAERSCSVTSAPFKAAPGKREIGLALKADLHSPDNSYNGVATLECLDAAGKVIDRLQITETFGKKDWQVVSKSLDLPKGTAEARFHVQLNKTYGKLWLDELSAAFVAPAPRRDDRIARMVLSTARLGNLWFPDDPRQATVRVEATKPLRDNRLSLTYVVRDYWGAEQMKPATATLVKGDKKDNRTIYEAKLDLSTVPLEQDRYYEIHATVPQEGEPFRGYTSFAILPEAETKKLKPDEVPFTSRNWDNRIAQYFELSDRLGLRTCGIWGGWSAKPPYKPEAPGLDLCEKFGMGALTNTPISTIERGKTDYTEEALRQGVRNWIEKYGKYRPLTINLGNEPHGKGDVVLRNVNAYKVVYEEIKKVDPTIRVLATAVEPNEEYFKAGYGKYCDAYDFHVYEGYQNVRRNIEQYQELMKKYDVVKPIWSTELGLNSQGLPRHAVAVELKKTLTTFFAAGGANASWFAIIYPDPEGKSAGSSGDAHNVFDSRYRAYAPRLDAVAYYHTVNAIGNKKFIAEKQYDGSISAILFRDANNRCLQALWKKGPRQDVFVPLPGVKAVDVVRVDGSRRKLDADGRGVTLTASEDPLLLLYDGASRLPEKLETPAATLTLGRTHPKAGPAMVTVEGKDAERVGLIAPPFWKVERATANGVATFTLTGPAESAIRELDLIVTIDDEKGNRRGELYGRTALTE